MIQYDLFLDENDWDIYYWATQEPTPTSRETAEGAGSGPKGATPNVQGENMGSPVAQGTDPGKQTGPELDTDHWRQGRARSGEWAQTIGAFKPAYRPVPGRWKNSEILAMLRRHVIERSAGGIHEAKAEIGGEALSQGVRGTGGGGETPHKHTGVAQLTDSRYGVYARSTQHGQVICSPRVYYCIHTKCSVQSRQTKHSVNFNCLTFASRDLHKIDRRKHKAVSNRIQVFQF